MSSQNLEAQGNISLQVIGLKLKAIKSVLNPEQLETYEKYLTYNQEALLTLLGKHLSLEEVDEVRKAIHN